MHSDPTSWWRFVKDKNLPDPSSCSGYDRPLATKYDCYHQEVLCRIEHAVRDRLIVPEICWQVSAILLLKTLKIIISALFIISFFLLAVLSLRASMMMILPLRIHKIWFCSGREFLVLIVVVLVLLSSSVFYSAWKSSVGATHTHKCRSSIGHPHASQKAKLVISWSALTRGLLSGGSCRRQIETQIN